MHVTDGFLFVHICSAGKAWHEVDCKPQPVPKNLPLRIHFIRRSRILQRALYRRREMRDRNLFSKRKEMLDFVISCNEIYTLSEMFIYLRFLSER